MDNLNINHSLTPVMDRGRVLSEPALIVGQYHCELYDKFGNKKCDDFKVKNGITNQGKNTLLEAYFNGGTAYDTWFAGIIDNDLFTQTNSGDTASSHTGWKEFILYQLSPTDLNLRVPWGQGAASSQQITNVSQMVFTFNGDGIIQGIFLINKQGHGDFTTAFLWSTALFNVPIPIQNGDILRISYTVSL